MKTEKMNFFTLMGLFLVVVGVTSWIRGKPILAWGAAAIPVGHYIYIIFGSIFFIVGLLSDSNKNKPEINMKCPECKKVFKESVLIETICPDCNVRTETLEGYFYRHPNDKIKYPDIK